MTEAAGAVGIDDPITLGGRHTTLREEHQRGKVALVRGRLRAQTGRWSLAYWAVVRKDRESAERFRLSFGDFKMLSGR